jgi:hypothetical protein
LGKTKHFATQTPYLCLIILKETSSWLGFAESP